MAKIKIGQSGDGEEQWALFVCPGCGYYHSPKVKGEGTVWKWNGSVDAPTLAPSLLANPNTPESRCHSFIKDGKIQFLTDCFHALKGQTVELPEIKE